MAYLTYLGANAGPPTENTIQPTAEVTARGPQAVKRVLSRRARSSRSQGARPATRSATTATTGPARSSTHIAARLPATAIARTLVNPDRADAVLRWVRRAAAKAVQRSRRLPLRSEVVADRAPGTLEAGQVRAMFDRIAGVYDPMNTLMTAGLHHRWRERAVELAAVGPGSRVIDVATGTGDLAIALARAVLRRRRGGRLRLLRGDARARAAEGAGAALRVGRRPDAALRDDQFDAATVGFGARNFSDLGRGLEEMARVVRPGGRVVVLEITRPTREPLASFYRALVRPHRAGARADRRRRRRLQLPAELGAPLPRAARARRRDGVVRAAAGSATCSPPAASSRCTSARSRVTRCCGRPVRRDPRAGWRAAARRDGRGRDAAARDHGDRGALAGDDRRRRQAPAPAAGAGLRPGRHAHGWRSRARRPRWS